MPVVCFMILQITALSVLSVNVEFRRLVDLFTHVFPILFPLSHTFGKEVFNLSVYGPEIILRPCRNLGVELIRQSQGNLFLLSH